MANKKISAFTELTEAPATTDVVPVVDVSDTTGAPTGTTKKVSLTNLSAGIVDISTSQLDAASLVTESEGISSNDNDTTLPTSAAVKDYVDTQVQAKDHLNELSGTLDDLTEGTTNKHFTATDETKLDGIETSATADQTGAEIKAAYEAEADTNAFTDADHTKLDGLEQSDWNSSSGGSQILNKPTVPSALNDLSNVNASPTDGQVLKWVNASSEWRAGDDSGGGGGGGGISNVSEDTTPQLGGDLDVNGNSIVSASNGDIAVTPDGTGKVVLDGINWPTADGSADQVLKTDGAGQLSFTAGGSGTVTGVTGTSPIVSDGSSTTPAISITDATTSAKGAASFSSDNFAVSSGAVTIKSAGVDLTDEVTGSLPDGNIASAATWNAKQDALTHGIANTNTVKVDAADVADDDFARFTASGLEGRSAAQVRSDIDASPSGHDHDSDYQPLDSELTTLAALTEARGSIIVGNSTPEWGALALGAANKVLTSDGSDAAWTALPVELGFAVSDETTALTTGDNKIRFMVPEAFTLTEVKASLTSAETDSAGLSIDVRYHATDPTNAGATVFTGGVINIAQNAFVGTQSGLAVTSLAENSFVMVDINGPTTPDATGLKIWLIGTRA